MQTKMKVEKPETIDLTLTVTMSLHDWMELRDQLQGYKWPSSDFSYEIGNLVRQAQAHFIPAKSPESTNRAGEGK